MIEEYRSKLFSHPNTKATINVFQYPGAVPVLDINLMYGGSLEEAKVEQRLLTEAMDLARMWELDLFSDEQLNQMTLNNDVRLWSKDTATLYLFKAELTYLQSRGWTNLIGRSDSKCMIFLDKSKIPTYYSHEEALSIQKKKDEITNG